MVQATRDGCACSNGTDPKKDWDVRLIVVLPFYSGDIWLAIKNLNWWRELDNSVPYECILSYDSQTNPAEVVALAKQYFKKVHQFRYDRIKETKWPYPQNHAFMSLAWHIYSKFPKCSFLWVECDSVVISSGWIQKIEECHIQSKKPFSGHWNEQSRVFNGVAVYPANVSKYAPKAMTAALTEGHQPPWDVFCSKEVEPHLNKANHLFQHIWRDDETGDAWTFPDMKTVRQVVRPGVVLFHRCKDGTLIDRLRGVNSPEPTDKPLVHGGDVGDLIYALPTMKALGGGNLLLVPDRVREPFTEAKVAKLAPLLSLQTYLKSVEFSPAVHGKAYDFTRFRDRYRSGKSLAQIQSEMFGKNGVTLEQPWLTVDRPVRTDKQVIIHRSSRYHNPEFPWRRVMEMYAQKALFVGSKKEWETFVREFGAIDYHPTADFLELARIIAGSKLFIGNQSAPYSIAEGLKHPAILESFNGALDCQFERKLIWNNSKLWGELPVLETL